jgi:cytochrome c5
MPTLRLPSLATGLTATLLAAASLAGVQPPNYPELGDGSLAQGRRVWLKTCATCHTDDFTGAPLVTDPKAWTPRTAKGRNALYTSALNGFFGPMGTEMPARGDNPALTDDEVRAAVDYMVALVEFLSQPAKPGDKDDT